MFLGVLMSEDVNEIPQSLCTDILGGLFTNFPDNCLFHWSDFLMGKTYSLQSFPSSARLSRFSNSQTSD
jgi:hypothetical protein